MSRGVLGVCAYLPPPPLWRRCLFPALWPSAHLSAGPPPPSASASPPAPAAGHGLHIDTHTKQCFMIHIMPLFRHAKISL